MAIVLCLFSALSVGVAYADGDDDNSGGGGNGQADPDPEPNPDPIPADADPDIIYFSDHEGSDSDIDFDENSDDYFQIYVYRNDVDVPIDPEDPLSEIFGKAYLHSTHSASKYKLSQIMYNFIFGSDLYRYDNYDGRCDISHKMIEPGGWLIWPMDSDFVECWGVYLPQDTYRLFFWPYIYG